MIKEEATKVDEEFKRAFNLGYRVAEELNLKSLNLENQEKVMSSNPMHLCMKQYVDEVKRSKNKRRDKSVDQNKEKSTKKESARV